LPQRGIFFFHRPASRRLFAQAPRAPRQFLFLPRLATGAGCGSALIASAASIGTSRRASRAILAASASRAALIGSSGLAALITSAGRLAALLAACARCRTVAIGPARPRAAIGVPNCKEA
jgi:hypothetical protein